MGVENWDGSLNSGVFCRVGRLFTCLRWPRSWRDGLFAVHKRCDCEVVSVSLGIRKKIVALVVRFGKVGNRAKWFCRRGLGSGQFF